MGTTIDDLLRDAVDRGASDVHLKVGSAPIVRVQGDLKRLESHEKLIPEDTEKFAEELMTPRASEGFESNGVTDFAYGKQDLGRFRVTAFRQRGSVSMVLRRVVAGSKSFSELGLPRIAEKVVGGESGLVVVTGRAGSGKSTTMASMVDWINSNQAKAILTIEDPIEVLHPDKKSVVVQREVGVDTPDTATAVRTAMRHDVDVIMISDMGDAATVKAAMAAAETGRLVITSMRTSDPAETVDRMISLFPESERAPARTHLSRQLQAVVSQILIENTDSQMVLASEVLTNNERVQEWITNGGDSQALVDIIKDGGFYGMQTFDQALLAHVVEKRVDISTALPFVRNTHELRAKAMEAGIAS